MPTLSTILLFLVVAFGFMLLPGPSNLFVVARGLGSGTRPAIAGAAGCATGSSAYMVATAAGLATLLTSSQLAFSVVHYLGAGYLLLLGVRAIRSSGEIDLTASAGPERLWTSYRQGLVVELANPKVALFYLALFPQFVHPERGPAVTQILVLGVLFVLIGLLIDSLYAIGSGRLAGWLRRRPRIARQQGRASGVLYLGLGAWALLTPASASGAPRPG